jgi:quinol-cytochrome oxidoreductase complex cytochrome b subunit
MPRREEDAFMDEDDVVIEEAPVQRSKIKKEWFGAPVVRWFFIVILSIFVIFCAVLAIPALCVALGGLLFSILFVVIGLVAFVRLCTLMGHQAVANYVKDAFKDQPERS